MVTGRDKLTYDLGTYLNVVFFALSIADVKKGDFHKKKKNYIFSRQNN